MGDILSLAEHVDGYAESEAMVIQDKLTALTSQEGQGPTQATD